MNRDELVEVLRSERRAHATVPPWLQVAGASIAALVGVLTLASGAVAAIAAAVMVSADLSEQGERLSELTAEVAEVRAEVARMRLEVAERTGDRWTRHDHERWVRDEYRPTIDALRAELRKRP